METKEKSLNKKRLIFLLAVLVVVLFAAVFALNMGGVRTRMQADSAVEVPVQSTDSNILVVYFAEAENSEVDMISFASVTVVDKVAKGRIRALADLAEKEMTNDLKKRYPSLDVSGKDCIHCGSCTKRCPFGIDASANMRRAKDLFGC